MFIILFEYSRRQDNPAFRYRARSAQVKDGEGKQKQKQNQEPGTRNKKQAKATRNKKKMECVKGSSKEKKNINKEGTTNEVVDESRRRGALSQPAAGCSRWG